MEADRPNTIRETDAEAIRLAKTLLRTARHGALAVLDPLTGAPMVSRVGTATDLDGAPLILVSGLSSHTGAILADPRCSLLVGKAGKGDPLAHPRLTIGCRAVKLVRGEADQERARRRYLNRNPKAELYAGLGDFSFFRLEPEGASLNGGFGKAYLLERADLLAAGPAVGALAESEQAALDHMNADHADAIAAYATHFARAEGEGWVMTGIDLDGFDLARGDDVRRVFFPAPLENSAELRKVLVEMAGAARAALAAKS